jgi:uncharacterized coiled-coil protein SlyX
MNPLIQSKNTTILPVLIALTLGCFGLSPQARAVCQEGCLTNGNTVLGDDALLNTTGNRNTAIGFNALVSNTAGSNNTSTGVASLYSNTGGSFNTSTGVESLYSNTSGSSNTATGFQALYLNNGGANTATGIFAMYNNTTGESNCAFGVRALDNNTTANNNTAVGTLALVNNTVGSNNIALGYFAGSNITTGSNNIEIGNAGVAGESRTIRIGNHRNHSKTFIAGIRDATTGNADAIPVLIDSAGQLGTMSSSRQFKKEIKPMDQTSEAILGLKPVTFHYKSDSEGKPQFGLIAEEVAQVNPDLVVRDENGEIYTVRYEAVNAMLLNEFLKAHRKIQEQEATITQLKSTDAKQEAAIADQQKQIAALTAGLQKVSAQVEMSRPAPQTVLNNQ